MNKVSLIAVGLLSVSLVGCGGYAKLVRRNQTGGTYALAGKVAVTTTLAACAGGVAAVLLSKALTSRYDPGLTVNANRNTGNGNLGPVPLLLRDSSSLGPPPPCTGAVTAACIPEGPTYPIPATTSGRSTSATSIASWAQREPRPRSARSTTGSGSTPTR